MQLPPRLAALGGRQRLVAAGAGLVVVLAILALAWGGGRPGMALLFGGLDDAAAGTVLAELEARGIPYEVAPGLIRVPAEARDRLRLQLAAEGLPGAGPAGYEILEGLSGFGTTERMFDAAYWRAREGELSRTITAALPGLGVRVHLSPAPVRGLGPRPDPSASVSLTGAVLPSPQRLQAIRHLVAASVPGLRPEAVVVVGPDGLVVGEGGEAAGADRAEAIAARARRLLEARVGPGRAIVEVGLDLVSESERVTERLIDPDSRTVISVESETLEREGPAGGGTVTVASNLPEGDADAGNGGTETDSQTRETTNYEISQTERVVERGPGAIRRMTVAVLVDLDQGPDGAPETRSEEELEALRGLVASATGFDEARGDSLTLHAMAFGAAGTAGGTPLPAADPSQAWPIATIVRAVAALAAIVLVGLFVLRPILRQPAPAPALPGPAAEPGTPAIEGVAVEAPPPPPALPPEPERREEPKPVPFERTVAARPRESVALIERWLAEGPA